MISALPAPAESGIHPQMVPKIVTPATKMLCGVLTDVNGGIILMESGRIGAAPRAEVITWGAPWPKKMTSPRVLRKVGRVPLTFPRIRPTKITSHNYATAPSSKPEQ